MKPLIKFNNSYLRLLCKIYSDVKLTQRKLKIYYKIKFLHKIKERGEKF